NHFSVVEIWKNQGAYEAHITAAPTKNFRDQLTPMSGALYDERLYKVISRLVALKTRATAAALRPAKNSPRAPRRPRGDCVCSEMPSVGLPARLRLGAGLLEVDVLVHVIDPCQRNEVVLAAGIRVILRQLDLIPAFQMVHRADVHAI